MRHFLSHFGMILSHKYTAVQELTSGLYRIEQKSKECFEAGLKTQFYKDLLGRAKSRELQLVSDLNCLQKNCMFTKKCLEEKNFEVNIYVDRCDELTHAIEEINHR